MWQLPYFLALTTSFILVAMMMWTGRRIFRNMRARLYFFLLLTVFFYVFGHSQELLQGKLDLTLFWLKFQYIGVSFIPFAMFALSYHSSRLKENERLNPWLYFLLLPGLLVFLMVMFYPRVRLFYTDVYMIDTAHGPVTGADRGFGYVIQYIQVILALAATVYYYVGAIIKARGSRRVALAAMNIAVFAIIAVYVLFMMGFFAEGVDPIVISIAFTAPLFAAVFYSDRLTSDIAHAKMKYFETSSNPVFIFNMDRQLIEFNAAASTAFSISRKSAINRSWFELLEDLEGGDIVIREDGQGIGKEITVRDRSFSYTSTVFRDGRGVLRGMLRSLYDVTEIKRALQVLEIEASIDGLTGLLTRRRWEQNTGQMLQQGQRFRHPGSILVMDLDHFKVINDTYGHRAGDAVLRECAGRIRSSLRGIDIIGRYGGEEIAVWLVETPPAGAFYAAEKIRTQIASRPVLHAGEEIQVTISIGLYGVNRIQKGEVHSYFEAADQALYRAKQEGRNRVVSAYTSQ